MKIDTTNHIQSTEMKFKRVENIVCIFRFNCFFWTLLIVTQPYSPTVRVSAQNENKQLEDFNQFNNCKCLMCILLALLVELLSIELHTIIFTSIELNQFSLDQCKCKQPTTNLKQKKNIDWYQHWPAEQKKKTMDGKKTDIFNANKLNWTNYIRKVAVSQPTDQPASQHTHTNTWNICEWCLYGFIVSNIVCVCFFFIRACVTMSKVDLSVPHACTVLRSVSHFSLFSFCCIVHVRTTDVFVHENDSVVKHTHTHTQPEQKEEEGKMRARPLHPIFSVFFFSILS